jgi:hypothetical protein
MDLVHFRWAPLISNQNTIVEPARQRRGCTIGTTFAVGVFLAFQALAQEGDGEKRLPSNFALMRDLAERIGTRVCVDLHRENGDTVDISVKPTESAWYVEGAIREGIMATGMVAMGAQGSTLTMEFGIGAMGVAYSSIRRLGLFGPTVVDRTVSVDLSARVVDRASGAVLLSRDYLDSTSDVVEVSNIRSLENPLLGITKGSLPEGGFFSNVAEPVIILASVAVAVFLLFHVRS